MNGWELDPMAPEDIRISEMFCYVFLCGRWCVSEEMLSIDLIKGILQHPLESSARRIDQSQVFSKNVKKMQTASVHKNGHSQLLQVQLFWEHNPRLSMQLFMGKPWLINVSHQFLRWLFLAISQTNLWYDVCVYMCVVYLYIIIYTIRWFVCQWHCSMLESIPLWESWWRA